MPAPNQPQSTTVQIAFSGGMISHLDPFTIPETGYRGAYNMVNRGGFLSTRPGYEWKATFQLPAVGFSKAQGLCHFKTFEGVDYLLMAVDGAIFTSAYPFNEFKPLGIRMREDAPEVFFAVCEQSATTAEDGSLTLIDPKRIVVIQDGLSTPVVWDGGVAVRDMDIPQGTCMAWSGNRLWVASGAELYASDIGDPTSFVETGYLGIGGAFLLPMRITALTESPQQAGLFIWTEGSMHSIASYIRDRNQWATTANFLQVISSTVGCVGQRAVTSQYGELWWMTRDGLANFDVAKAAFVSSTFTISDAEMAVSKAHLCRDLSSAALGTYGNYLMASVPYGSLMNRHTWVMDGTPVPGVAGAYARPAWASIWTGTNPFAWASGLFAGASRAYFLSQDADGRCSLWEAFSSLDTDSGIPIRWQVETRGYGIDGFSRYNLQAVELRFGNIRGVLDLAVFTAPSQHGTFTNVARRRDTASITPLAVGTAIPANDFLQGAAAGGYRQFRTGKPGGTLTVLCDVQVPDRTLITEAVYSLVIAGVGRASLTGLRLMTLPESENQAGNCDIGAATAALYDGTAYSGEFPVDAGFSNAPFTSTQTAPGLGGQPNVVSTALSSVSQPAADRIALETGNALALQRYLAKVKVAPMPPSSIV